MVKTHPPATLYLHSFLLYLPVSPILVPPFGCQKNVSLLAEDDLRLELTTKSPLESQHGSVLHTLKSDLVPQCSEPRFLLGRTGRVHPPVSVKPQEPIIHYR